jgi:hypothetical protein
MLIAIQDDRFTLLDGCDADLLVAKERCGFKWDIVTGRLTGAAANVGFLKKMKDQLRDKLRITVDALALYEPLREQPVKSGMEMGWNETKERFEVFLAPGPSWKQDLAAVKEAGFKYNPDLKLWWTRKKSIAVTLRNVATERALLEIGEKVLGAAPKAASWTIEDERTYRELWGEVSPWRISG